MIRDVQYPEELFTGSEVTLKALRNKIDLSIGGSPSF
jgi:hypothetical protein